MAFNNSKKWKTVFDSEVDETDSNTYLKARKRLNKINRVSRSTLPTIKTDDGESGVVVEYHPHVSVLKSKFESFKHVAKKMTPFGRSLKEPDTDFNGNAALELDQKNIALMKLARKLGITLKNNNYNENVNQQQQTDIEEEA